MLIHVRDTISAGSCGFLALVCVDGAEFDFLEEKDYLNLVSLSARD